MKLLLDTHTFLWLDSDPDKLSPNAQRLCRDKTHILLLSLVSVWEIQIKWQLGKLQLNQPLAQKIETQQKFNQLHLADYPRAYFGFKPIAFSSPRPI